MLSDELKEVLTLNMVREVIDLKNLYEGTLKKLNDKFATCNGQAHIKKNLTSIDYNVIVQGQISNNVDVIQEWENIRIEHRDHPEWGPGTIKAIKKIGTWNIPGVEFDFEPELNGVVIGHSLGLRTTGQEGKSFHCLWIPIDKCLIPEAYKQYLEDRGIR